MGLFRLCGDFGVGFVLSVFCEVWLWLSLAAVISFARLSSLYFFSLRVFWVSTRFLWEFRLPLLPRFLFLPALSLLVGLLCFLV